ncbi:MAG: hypothetical protein AB7E05_10205 [Sphingobium sp.]
MVHNTEKPGFLAQFWQVLLETSEVAVAIQYREPWARSRPVQPDAGLADRASSEPACTGWQDCRL